jgi:signal transduction histidine kinase
MTPWKSLFKPSVYWRILAGFALIILLLVLATASTYVRLVQVRAQTDQAVPSSQFTVTLRQFAAAISQFDNDLQRYFIVGGAEIQDEMNADLSNMQHTLDAAPQNLDPRYVADLGSLKDTTSKLSSAYASLLTMNSQQTDALTMNMAIWNVTILIDAAKQSEQQLSTTILGDLDGLIVSQMDAINGTLTILIVATSIALILGMTVSLVVSRSLVLQLTEVASAAGQIAGGKWDARVPVRSKDEPGQLAVAFNTMAEQLQQSLRNLQESHNSLERSNEELKIATAQAKESSRLKDEFLSIMSHELRTPLNAIIGFLGIMAMTGNFDDRNQHMLERVRANSERLLALINDVLDISRIEAGRLQLFPAPLSVAQIAEQVKTNMSILAEQKGLNFTVIVDSSLPPAVSIDQDAITKIATNLLSNAFKFTDQGEVTLSLAMHEHNLIIKVADTGIGIPPHMHDIIFERFRQVDASSTRQHGGSGLGLSIVQHLCKAMQGSVSVESAEGKGSTFTVSLPVPETALQTAGAS